VVTEGGFRTTEHALHRYRRRIAGSRATAADVAAVMAAGVFRRDAPHGINVNIAGREEEPDGYIVNGTAVFPVKLENGNLVALTCLKAVRRSKADRRAWREAQREVFA
jgi:hypothetical protein